ncbi:hypothetical protein MMC22_000685 [Lobaria immixta]|nr:hypothetical protein [Lobaria immixta]
MSKKSFKTQASSSRAFSGALGQPEVASSIGNFGGTSIFGAVPSSFLSYVYEPPDLSNISEPSVVVALKNLQKKDSTTKSKALKDLQGYVLSLAVESGGVEEAILEAWIKIYPRASIDSSRRVRQLAHLLQGQIAVSCGKRIAKSMPQIVSSWLAGLYDNDRSVTRSTRESLRQVFTSEEKLKSLWRVYQSSIVGYAEDAVEKETVNTLSDERSTSPDDASAKYARVVGAAISMCADETPTSDQEKSRHKIDGFVGQEKVWKFASDPDPYLRLAVYRLATTAFTKSRGSLDLGLISTHMLGSSLNVSQVGSAFKYATAIATLTIKSPDIWTKYHHGSGKKSAIRRLCQYLRRGSQGGPPEYWAQINNLVHHLPLNILLPEVEIGGRVKEASELDPSPGSPLLEALREGITSKQEPIANLGIAWNTYLDVCELVVSFSPSQSSRDHFAQGSIVPLVRQCISPSADQLEWAVSGPDQPNICVRAFRQVLNISPETFQEEWRHLSAKIIEDFQTSLPEKSKDYIKSQDSISAKIARWYDLQAAILKDQSEILHSLIATTLVSELNMCTHTLRERSGKPYSAAAVLVHAIESLPELVRAPGETQRIITKFAQEDIPRLLLSPSAPQLIATLSRINEITDVCSIYESAISDLRKAPESAAKSNTLKSFISSPFLAEPAKIEALVITVKESLKMAKHGSETHWDLVMAAVGNKAASNELADELLADITNGLSIKEESSACLEGLELTAKRNGQALKAFTISTNGSTLLSKLLVLAESPDSNMSERAHRLTIAIEAILSDGKDSAHAVESMIEIINQGIDMAGQNSLSIDALVEQAQKLLHQALQHDVPALVVRLLPNSTQWTTVLKPFITQLPNPSMSIMTTLGGAINLIDREMSQVADVRSISRDFDGCSPALRMAWYVTKLLNTTDVFDHTTEEQRVVLIQHLATFTQLATHNISVPGSVPLWENIDLDIENEVSRLITDIQTLRVNWIRDNESLSKDLINTTQGQLLQESRGTSASSYHNACAYSSIGSELVELHGDFGSQEDLEQLDTVWTSPDIFTKAALLATAFESKLLFKLCSKLFDDLTGHNFHKKTHEGLLRLVFLNCIVDTHEDFLARIPSQRLIFFVKHLISQANDGMLGISIQTEMMKILKVAIKPIKEIYGVFWEELIDLVQRTWALLDKIRDDDIPLLHASLRLFEQLKRLRHQESNDDLQDAWSENQTLLDKGLLKLLLCLQDISDESHEPRKIVNALLARQLKALTYDSTSQARDLYPALASESLALQQSAYEILHQNIPKNQEQVSLDKALTKDFVAKLPEELLSLILAAPGLDTLAVASFERDMPATLQSYLLSWKLVYDHWKNSSSRVKADYANCLKDGTYVQTLLDLATNLLINRRSKPVNASQFDIESYNLDTFTSPETKTHSLLIHLYYLSLKYLPHLSKTWWRDTTSRQTVTSVEAWTEKYISPKIIASELSTISEWAPSQSTSDQPLTVKVSPSAREITAGIPIDEQHMQIAIRLPASYPLARATVDSVHRVGVDEKKWHSWLMTTQGVINFSSSGDESALIDGLLAWRRNVTATLKGQTECAICYSVVGADRQLPGKRCGTCKNMFHGSCLFRWFKSSNSSSCPLCRNAFHYS